MNEILKKKKSPSNPVTMNKICRIACLTTRVCITCSLWERTHEDLSKVDWLGCGRQGGLSSHPFSLHIFFHNVQCRARLRGKELPFLWYCLSSLSRLGREVWCRGLANTLIPASDWIWLLGLSTQSGHQCESPLPRSSEFGWESRKG